MFKQKGIKPKRDASKSLKSMSSAKSSTGKMVAHSPVTGQKSTDFYKKNIEWRNKVYARRQEQNS